MGNDLLRQLREDKALRDAARAIIDADISHIKTDFEAKNVGARVATRMKEGSVDVFEQAVEVAEDNRSVLVTLIAAVILWFARNPVMSLFSDEEPHTETDTEFDPE